MRCVRPDHSRRLPGGIPDRFDTGAEPRVGEVMLCLGPRPIKRPLVRQLRRAEIVPAQ
jgi:hypothetical protein